MSNSVRAIVRNGKIELLEPVELAEGAAAFVTLVSDDDAFWLAASRQSADEVWDNPQDDVYADLLAG